MNRTSSWWLALFLAIACSDGVAPVPGAGNDGGPDLASIDVCDECLRQGGVWQVDSCEANCNLGDASCYEDACPAPCGPGSCGGCEQQEACEEAGCEWAQDEEAMWCRAP